MSGVHYVFDIMEDFIFYMLQD